MLLLCLLLPGKALAQDRPCILQFEQIFSTLSCACPPGETLTHPPVDPAMILRPRTRYRPQIRILRPSSQAQPAFRNLACRPLRRSTWINSLQTQQRWFIRSPSRSQRLRFFVPFRF